MIAVDQPKSARMAMAPKYLIALVGLLVTVVPELQAGSVVYLPQSVSDASCPEDCEVAGTKATICTEKSPHHYVGVAIYCRCPDRQGKVPSYVGIVYAVGGTPGPSDLESFENGNCKAGETTTAPLAVLQECAAASEPDLPDAVTTVSAPVTGMRCRNAAAAIMDCVNERKTYSNWIPGWNFLSQIAGAALFD